MWQLLYKETPRTSPHWFLARTKGIYPRNDPHNPYIIPIETYIILRNMLYSLFPGKSFWNPIRSGFPTMCQCARRARRAHDVLYVIFLCRGVGEWITIIKPT